MVNEFDDVVQSKPRARRQRRNLEHSSKYRFFSLVIVPPLLVASVLLWLSIPRLVVAFYELPGNNLLETFRLEQEVSIPGLTRLLESRQLAATWLTEGHTLSEMSLAYVGLAQRMGSTTTTAGRASLSNARQALISSLALAPANGYAWAHLAYVQMALFGPSPDVVRDLLLSFETARFEYRLMLYRLDMAFALRAFWDSELTELMPAQVRMAWSRNDIAVAKLSVRYNCKDFVRTALALDTDQLQRYERMAQ